jgi:hypothetical protein
MSAPGRSSANAERRDVARDVADAGMADKAEDWVKLAILSLVMLASLAASFTHMKHWTMRWMPDDTPDWFGWANAVISELVPLGATLSLRKRLRQGKPLWSYALVVLLAGALLSLAAQLSAVGADASLSAKFLAALPAIAFLLLSKLVLGDLDSGRRYAEIEADRQRDAEQTAARHAEQLRQAQVEIATARRAQAEAEEHAQAETARAEAEIAAGAEAEIRAAEAARRAETEAAARAETEARAEAEIAAHQQAAGEAAAAATAAERRAQAAAEAARLAEGRLAEARDAADRAAAARVAAEQAAAEQVRQLITAGEQAERDHRRHIAALREQAHQAEVRAAELAEALRAAEVQRDHVQQWGDRQAAARAAVEQLRQTLIGERDAALGEVERLRRSLARAQEQQTRPEIGGRARAEITRPAGRKSLAAVAAPLPADLPEVETVRPETVALVLAARAQHPAATQAELSGLTGVSDRTIRKVINAVPAEVVGRVLALTEGRVA